MKPTTPPRQTQPATPPVIEKAQKPTRSSIRDQLIGFKNAVGRRYKALFALSAAAVIMYALLTLNLILSQPVDEDYRTKQLQSASSAQFDKKTIERINKLDNVAPLDPEKKPANPFSPVKDIY